MDLSSAPFDRKPSYPFFVLTNHEAMTSTNSMPSIYYTRYLVHVKVPAHIVVDDVTAYLQGVDPTPPTKDVGRQYFRPLTDSKFALTCPQ